MSYRNKIILISVMILFITGIVYGATLFQINSCKSVCGYNNQEYVSAQTGIISSKSVDRCTCLDLEDRKTQYTYTTAKELDRSILKVVFYDKNELVVSSASAE